MRSRSDGPVRIYYSYAVQDIALLEKLDGHLGTLRRQGRIETWWRGKTLGGAERIREADEQLAAAQIILLLISADFVQSDRCIAEAKHAMKRRAEDAIVIPVRLRPADIQRMPFQKLEAFPMDDRAITQWDDQDAAFLNVVEGIRKVLDTSFSRKSISRKNPLKQDFAEERQQEDEPFLSTTPPAKLNLRDTIITAYDLDRAMGNFRAELIHGEATGFVIASDIYLLSQYVLKRAIQEFKEKIQGNHFLDEIHLRQADLHNFTPATLIEEKLKHRYNYARACDLVTKHPRQHVMLTMWNHDLPGEMLREAAISFWQQWLSAISMHLHKKYLCFVLILAHLPSESDPGPIDGFTSIHLPTSSDMQKGVSPWVAAKLRELGVPPGQERRYLDQLNDPHADCIQILRNLETIADSLQGIYDIERYNERRQHKRRTMMR
jgi:hypothetical protein